MKLLISYSICFFLFLSVIELIAQSQNDIPWSTLADSPWPMIKKNPQATGRANVKGPQTNNIVWTFDNPYGIQSG